MRRHAEPKALKTRVAIERDTIGRDPIGSIIVARNPNVIDAHVPTATPASPRGDAATVEIATELAAIRTFLARLASAHARKIERALDDACDEARKRDGAGRIEFGKARDRALAHARSTARSPRSRIVQHLTKTVARFGDAWRNLLDPS